MKDRLFVFIQYLLPHHLISRLAGCLADEYWGVRAAAVEALGTLTDAMLSAHRAALEKCRDDDDDDDVRSAAARLLDGRSGVVV